MALNKNTNEEQDMPVPQEPVQQQEKEEKLKAAGWKVGNAEDFLESPEGVPTELVEEVAKGVEDALWAQAQEPSMQVEPLIYPPPGQEPGGIAEPGERQYIRPKSPEEQASIDRMGQIIKDGSGRAGNFFGGREAFLEELGDAEQKIRKGPETIFDATAALGSSRYLTTDLKEPEVDYDFGDPKSKVSVLFNRGFVDDMVNSQGYVAGSNAAVRELISMDRQIAEENGIEFSFRNAYLGSMGDLYIDAMKRLGKNVSKLNPNSQRFQKYAASAEGAREIDQALTFVYYHDKFNGEIPGNIKKKLKLPGGRGRLDSRYAGLTDQDYENMGALGKIGYNIAVAGKTMADTALPGFEDITPEVVPGVAPAGELIGTMAGYMVPFSAAGKVMAAKNILSAPKYAGIPGWAVRSAVAGAAADTYVFDSDEGTMANMFAESDSVLINNAFTTALAIDIDDPEWEAKAKIAVEGVILGGMLDATVSKLRKLKEGERIPGFFNKMKARLGGDGLPKTSGLTPELDKTILELKAQRQSLQKKADKVAKKLAETPGSGHFVETLGVKLKEIKDEILELATIEDVLEGKYVDEDKLEALAGTTKKRVNENLPASKEEVVQPKVTEQDIQLPDEEYAEDQLEWYDLPGPKLIVTRLREKLEKIKKAEATVEGSVKVEKRVRGILGEIDETFERQTQQLHSGELSLQFESLRQETDDLIRKKMADALAIAELVEGARVLYRANPSLQNQTRLALAYDILEEVNIPFAKRRRSLVPADIKTNLDNLSTISTKPDVELKEILINRGRSNKAHPDVIAKQVEKHGIEKATKLTLGRWVRGTADILVDMRTNNILYSLGIPYLATAGGALVKGFRGSEILVGKGLQKVWQKVTGLRGTPTQRTLITSTKEKIKTLEAKLGQEPDDATVKELKEYRLQLRNLDRTSKKAKKEIKILKQIEAATDDKTQEKLLKEAEEMGLVVEDPRIRQEAKRLWKEVDNLRAAGESAEKIDEAVKLAKEQTELVPKENPNSISDLEAELKALKDPTYRSVDTTAATVDNIFYTLSGGKIQLAGRSPEPEDLWRLITGLLSASAPSRIDPAIATKSETLLGAGLKAGYNADLGIDPAGLGRLGKWAQGIENPWGRHFSTILFSILEFIPRKGLATIDEGLKTRDFIREFMMRLDENIKSLQVITGATGVQSLDQQELVKEIQEAFISLLGNAEGGTEGAINFAGAIMGRLRRAKEAIDPEVTPQLEQDLVLLEKLRQLENLPEGVKESIDETLGKAVEATKKGRLITQQEADVQKVLEKTVEEAQQFARETTVTQDVPPMMQGLIKGIQRYAPLRGIAPFARATTNIGAMTVARIPFLSAMIRKERQALTGALGEIEQARSLGKLGMGAGLIGTGILLTDDEGVLGVRLEVVDHGSWREYNLVIPMSGQDFEDHVRASALRWYTNNSEIIARELEREGLPNTAENAVEYILDNLPEWEDRAGSVKIDFSRLGPFNTLIQAGMLIRDVWDTTSWEYLTEKEEENSSIMDIVTQTFHFVNDQGYLRAADDFFKMADNPEYAAEAFVKGWGADLISHGKGIFSTAGEPGQRDFRPSREEDMWQQKTFNQPLLRWTTLAEDPNTLMKKRDFLGRVIDAPDRAAHIVGKKYDVDLITSEMEEMGFVKRVSRPTSVTKFPDIDLRKFKLKSALTKEQKELLSTVVAAKDGQNAYEDFLIMSGSINVAANKYDATRGSAINGLQKYFKSQEYKLLKDTILSLDEDSSPDEKNEAEVSYDQIRKRVNKWISIGREQAALALYDMGDMYINEDGNSLREISDATYEGRQRAGFEVNKRLQGLDALRSGGNK